MRKLSETKKLKVAICGSLGSGKTTITNIIKEQGYPIFNCDQYNASLIQNNTYVINEIAHNFDNVLVNNRIDKSKLAQIVFSDSVKLVKLNKILHPLIIEEMLRQMNQHDIIFVEVPLLFELKLNKYFDYVICVVCNQDKMLQRAKTQGLNIDNIKKRLNYQLPQSHKIKNSDFVVYNNNIDELKRDILDILGILGL